LLENGAATFSIAPRRDRAPFTVLAGDASIRTVDGEFRVAREGEHASVRVERGSVEIRFRGREIRLDADQSWAFEDQPAR
jgi:ferric-dicitrate binding protein FerR (iron transport regulator)